jgi:transcriptional regulator of acetoin/glycerol metabolism
MRDPAICLPTLPSRQELRDITTAWEAFMAGDAQELEKVRPVIRASWERCRSLGVDPHLARLPSVCSAEDMEAAQEGADLVAVATPLFETVVQAWSEERFMLGVSDRHGCLLYTDGHPVVLDYARQVNAVPGGGMTETLIGTASANVVLAQGRADYVLWSEHYCQGFHTWAAIGAPVFHPITCEIIGVVGAAGEELAHPRALDIIQRIAERIQQLIHHEETLRRVELLNAYHRFLLQHPRDLVLAIDRRGHICGASPTIGELIDAPQNVLDTSFLRLPDLCVEGFHHPTRQDDARPYGIHLTRRCNGAVFNATAIPVEGKRQSTGILIVVSRPPATGQRRHEPSPSVWRATHTFADLIGACSIFQESMTLAHHASRSDFPVLLLGESGTGKELFAQAIHTASPRGQGPFVAVNCGVPGDDLLAAELFGYVEGAFTGALKGGRKGKIELAHGGALFLDEVEAMSPKMQVSLLRVLEEQRIVRLGSERPVVVDIRVIAASNEDLRAAVSQKRFRADLYHRLCALPIQLPPLRERHEDLPLLARHLLRQLGFPQLRLAPETLRLLRQYAWPGNIRELKHVLLRAAQQTTGTTILPTALPDEITAIEPSSPTQAVKSLRSSERDLIVQALTEAHGSPTRAAEQLGIHRTTLYRKLKKYGLASLVQQQSAPDA